MNIEVYFYLFFALVLGAGTAAIGKGRGYSPILCFFVGLGFSLLGALIVQCLPNKKKEAQDKLDRQEAEQRQAAAIAAAVAAATRASKPEAAREIPPPPAPGTQATALYNIAVGSEITKRTAAQIRAALAAGTLAAEGNYYYDEKSGAWEHLATFTGE
jgi:hypothetical protein